MDSRAKEEDLEEGFEVDNSCTELKGHALCVMSDFVQRKVSQRSSSNSNDHNVVTKVESPDIVALSPWRL